MKTCTKVLAVKRVDFTNDEGDHIVGRQIWCCIPATEPAWNGAEVLKIWVADDSSAAGDAAALLNGDDVIVEFTRRGKPYISDFAPVIE